MARPDVRDTISEVAVGTGVPKRRGKTRKDMYRTAIAGLTEATNVTRPEMRIQIFKRRKSSCSLPNAIHGFTGSQSHKSKEFPRLGLLDCNPFTCKVM
jgi:hypothetical protein